MKKCMLIAVLLLSTLRVFAQNDALNLDKYWKFRNDFKEKFIRIGPDPGQSLPVGALKPLDCVDNDGDPVLNPYGEMDWGDGMIRHGHYLVLLATEYKLLKNSGKDVTPVLNELYYALAAINRLDRRAEFEQAPFYDYSLSENLNGFFLREDVGENFATNNWGTDPMRMACTNSVYYFNNNFAKLDDNAGLEVKFNSYQNVPSLDQLTSLMVGFSMIHKLLDDVYVKPTSSDAGFQIVTETKAIVHRMMTYASSHNWFLIDVNGWPVNNGGGDLSLMSVPLSTAATRITNQIYPLELSRRFHKYDDLRECITGYGTNDQLTQEEQANACLGLGVSDQIVLQGYLSDAGTAGPLNNQQLSQFQIWQLTGMSIQDGIQSASLLAWTSLIPGTEPLYDTYMDLVAAYAEETWAPDFLANLQVDDYNETIMFNCGVTSQLWDYNQVASAADKTQNRQLELIDCILKGVFPSKPMSFYRNFLDQMPATGPYQMKGQNWTENGQNIYNQIDFAPNGWASEYRWTHPTESLGNHTGTNGAYSALDYMVFHNLYRLLFANTITSETNYYCNCTSQPTVAPPANANSYQLEANLNLNQKLAFLPTCADDVLAPVNHSVTGVFNIQAKFSSYDDIGIYTTKSQRTNAAVQNGGELHVRTRFSLCSNTLTVNSGGKMLIEKNETIIGYNGVLDITGELRVKAGTTLTIHGKLILRQGSVLEVESGAYLYIGGSVEYYNGANFYTSGTASEINISGKIKTMNASTFSIGTTQPANSSRGKLILNNTTLFEALSPSVFDFYGKGKDIDFIELRGPVALSYNVSNITLKFRDCALKFMVNSGINAVKNIQFSNTKLYSSYTNFGVTVRGVNNFSSCSFTNVPLIGDFSLPGVTDKLIALQCNFLNNGVYQNSDNYLVRVLGTGYALTNCSFTTNTGVSQLYSYNLTLPSSANSCSFTQNATGTSRTTSGIREISNIELTVKSGTFNQLATGITKNYGKLTLRCSNFSNVKTNNLLISNGGLLNMSSSDLAGYNTLNAPTSGSSIVLNQSNIALTNGYNFISDSGSDYCISGTVTTACVPPGCITTVTQNQWNSGNTVPSSSKFHLLNGQSYIMLVQSSPVTTKPLCPADAPKSLEANKPAETPEKDDVNCEDMPKFYSEIMQDTFCLSYLVNAAIERTSAFSDSSGNDVNAIELFDEIFSANLNLKDTNTYIYSWMAFEYMKSAVENAVADGLITEFDNISSFEPHVAMYVNALMKLTDSVIIPENYLTQFYHEFDKAHLFRVIGHAEIGLGILTELEYCGIDSVQQEQLNYWKTVFETDVIIQQIGEESIDSVITVDTSEFISPSSTVNAFTFGAMINSMSDIAYPNCAFFSYKSKLNETSGLIVFPNPSSHQVTILFPEKILAGSYLEILQMDGRNVLRLDIDSSMREVNLDVNSWSAGTYQIILKQPSGDIKYSKLVIY